MQKKTWWTWKNSERHQQMFLKNKSSFENNQETLEIKNILRGEMIKIWTGINFETSEHQKGIRIILKEFVMFHAGCWTDRCNSMHDEEEQKKIPTQWHGNVFDETTNGEREARSHAERTKLGIGRAQNETSRSWMFGSLQMKRKVKKNPQAEIGRGFNGWKLTEHGWNADQDCSECRSLTMENSMNVVFEKLEHAAVTPTLKLRDSQSFMFLAETKV